jgi:hypothetical protein
MERYTWKEAVVAYFKIISPGLARCKCKITKKAGRISRSQRRDLNLELPVTQLRHSVKFRALIVLQQLRNFCQRTTSTLNKEALCCSETLITTCKTAQYHNYINQNPNFHRSENVKILFVKTDYFVDSETIIWQRREWCIHLLVWWW